ncbi:MAG: hypothetical protein KHY44_04480 [Clostridiales bacterium]|nr:hypothetical protein [Clostridiales bacterium]
MNLIYEYSGIMRSIDSIMAFTGEEQTDFWSEPFFYFFPDIDKKRFKTLTNEQRKQYLIDYFFRFEKENKEIIAEKIYKYNERWETYQSQIVDALQEAFGVDLMELFNDMRGYITFNPVCPRYLENNTFDVFYLNSEKGALGLSIHEIIHFVWFHVWNNYFHDSYDEYELPHLKWILSEMVVEPIMRDERLRAINPYFDGGGCVYPYFYTLKIENRPILDILYEMYQSMNMVEFMKKSYELCLKYEALIREHIDTNER